MPFRNCLRRIAALAAAVTIAGTVTSTVSAQSPLLPAPDGPSPIGYFRTLLPTATRDSTSPGGQRTLQLEIWYPAAAPSSGPFKRYMTVPVRAALKEQLSLSPVWADSVTTHAVEGAAP